MSTATVGRVVHYVARGSADGVFPPACRAAVVTEAGGWVDVQTRGPVEEDGKLYREVSQRWDPEAMFLHVMNPTGEFTHGPMEYDNGMAPVEPQGRPVLCDGRIHEPGSWHWPHLGGAS